MNIISDNDTEDQHLEESNTFTADYDTSRFQETFTKIYEMDNQSLLFVRLLITQIQIENRKTAKNSTRLMS